MGGFRRLVSRGWGLVLDVTRWDLRTLDRIWEIENGFGAERSEVCLNRFLEVQDRVSVNRRVVARKKREDLECARGGVDYKKRLSGFTGASISDLDFIKDFKANGVPLCLLPGLSGVSKGLSDREIEELIRARCRSGRSSIQSSYRRTSLKWETHSLLELFIVCFHRVGSYVVHRMGLKYGKTCEVEGPYNKRGFFRVSSVWLNGESLSGGLNRDYYRVSDLVRRGVLGGIRVCICDVTRLGQWERGDCKWESGVLYMFFPARVYNLLRVSAFYSTPFLDNFTNDYFYHFFEVDRSVIKFIVSISVDYDSNPSGERGHGLTLANWSVTNPSVSLWVYLRSHYLCVLNFEFIVSDLLCCLFRLLSICVSLDFVCVFMLSYYDILSLCADAIRRHLFLADGFCWDI